jgi:hypothetical protein
LARCAQKLKRVGTDRAWHRKDHLKNTLKPKKRKCKRTSQCMPHDLVWFAWKGNSDQNISLEVIANMAAKTMWARMMKLYSVYQIMVSWRHRRCNTIKAAPRQSFVIHPNRGWWQSNFVSGNTLASVCLDRSWSLPQWITSLYLHGGRRYRQLSCFWLLLKNYLEKYMEKLGREHNSWNLDRYGNKQ